MWSVANIKKQCGVTPLECDIIHQVFVAADKGQLQQYHLSLYLYLYLYHHSSGRGSYSPVAE